MLYLLELIEKMPIVVWWFDTYRSLVLTVCTAILSIILSMLALRTGHAKGTSQLVTSEHITKPPVPVVIIYTPSASGDIQKQR